MKDLSVTELARNLSDTINRVAYKQESFLIRKGGKPVAELRPVTSGLKVKDLPAFLESLPKLSKEEARAFAKDIERARKEQSKVKERDPWAF